MYPGSESTGRRIITCDEDQSPAQSDDDDDVDDDDKDDVDDVNDDDEDANDDVVQKVMVMMRI